MGNTFPQFYRPRPYQLELHEMWRNYRIGVAVYPRQSGKDAAMSMHACEGRLKTPKTTAVYVSLDNPSVRDILWDKTYLDPPTGQYVRMLQDNVPADQVTWRNTSMMGRFANHSRLKLQGYFQSGKETNGVGSSFQEYYFTELSLFTKEDPLPRLLPIISNEQEPKKLGVASTPRGKRRNPLWQLMKSFEGSPDFKVLVRTIDDLNEMMRRQGLPEVRSQAQLEQDREAYRRRFGNDRMFEQEYYCSFEEMDAAAVYGEALRVLQEEKRDTVFNLDPAHPVYVCFDIGSAGRQSDATSWIAFQWFNNKLFLYDCGEGHGRPLPEYLDDLRQKHWFGKLDRIVVPWDAEHHSAAIRETPADMLRKVFPRVSVLARSNKAFKLTATRSMDSSEITDIQLARMQLYNTIIHKTQCDLLLEHMENYKYEFSNKLQTWSDTPVHDKSSHMMDAFRYTVQATKELDVFSGTFYDTGSLAKSTDYEESWAGVW